MNTDSERIERLLALLLLQSMKDNSPKEKAIRLNIAGFSNIEIAELLDTSPNNVALLIHRAKKSSKSKK